MAALIDTNILVYRFDPRYPAKQAKATALLKAGIADDSIRVPHQALLEFVAATTKPLSKGGPSLLSPGEARLEMEDMLLQFEVVTGEHGAEQREIGNAHTQPAARREHPEPFAQGALHFAFVVEVLQDVRGVNLGERAVFEAVEVVRIAGVIDRGPRHRIEHLPSRRAHLSADVQSALGSRSRPLGAAQTFEYRPQHGTYYALVPAMDFIAHDERAGRAQC